MTQTLESLWPVATWLSLTTLGRTVWLINLYAQFTPLCGGRRELFWPPVPQRHRPRGFLKGRTTFPTRPLIDIECFLSARFDGSAHFRAQEHPQIELIFHLSSGLVSSSPGKWSMCNSPQRPSVILCGHFNWASLRWVIKSYLLFIASNPPTGTKTH